MIPQHQNDSGEATTFMSLSGDASCNGLYSSKEGQTLVLEPGDDRISVSLDESMLYLEKHLNS